MAAHLEPQRMSAGHQSLHRFISKSECSGAAFLSKFVVGCYADRARLPRCAYARPFFANGTQLGMLDFAGSI